jgi:hypothetical protein
MKTNTILGIVSILIVMGLYQPVSAAGFDHSKIV